MKINIDTALTISVGTTIGVILFLFLGGRTMEWRKEVDQEAQARWQAMARQAKTPQEKQVATYVESKVRGQSCHANQEYHHPDKGEHYFNEAAYKQRYRDFITGHEAHCATVFLGQLLTEKQAPGEAFARTLLEPLTSKDRS